MVNEDDETAVGLVGVNNIHLSREEADSAEYHVCQGNEVEGHILLDQVGDVNDIVDGVVYACTYEDLRAAFEEVPPLDFTPGLLE